MSFENEKYFLNVSCKIEISKKIAAVDGIYFPYYRNLVQLEKITNIAQLFLVFFLVFKQICWGILLIIMLGLNVYTFF